MQLLRAKNISCDFDYNIKSIKNQFKSANKRNAKYALIVGEEELKNNKFKLKNMDTSEERDVALSDIAKFIN